MAERILTLCDKCAEEMKNGGFRVKQINGSTTTERKKACENCGQRVGGMCKQFIVGGKGK